ncbi:MAG TPA: AMIN domain-containing protein, partial [Allocoleopsis sp.]
MQTVVKFPWLVSGLVGSLLLSAPAQADVLQSWRFDARQNQLEINTDEGVQPTAQLIANPTRIVIDLPGIRLGRPKTSQMIGGTVQAVRTGQFNAQTARLVVELAPGYTVDPQQVQVKGSSFTRWTVQLPTPQPTTAIANPPSNVPQAIATIAPPPDTFGGLVP